MEKKSYFQKDDPNIPQASTVNSFEKEYSEFIDIAVHDLDAPLRKLGLLVEILTDKLSPDEDLQSHIKRIENCVGDMRSLIDSLSVLSKVTPDKREVTSCKLDSIVQEAMKDVYKITNEKKIVITTYPLPIVKGDPQLYSILFEILLANAIKFSRKDRQPEIHIRSGELNSKEKNELNITGDGIYYKIEVNDNGIGFKNEYAEKIFNPFVRLHGKSQFPGNGIGLAICRKIMDVNHGIIYAEGRENEGARFILILPESHSNTHA